MVEWLELEPHNLMASGDQMVSGSSSATVMLFS